VGDQKGRNCFGNQKYPEEGIIDFPVNEVKKIQRNQTKNNPYLDRWV